MAVRAVEGGSATTHLHAVLADEAELGHGGVLLEARRRGHVHQRACEGGPRALVLARVAKVHEEVAVFAAAEEELRVVGDSNKGWSKGVSRVSAGCERVP